MRISANLPESASWRDPAEIRRSVQIFLHLREPERVAAQVDMLPRFAELGCEHAVLSFCQPPSTELLERCAALAWPDVTPCGLRVDAMFRRSLRGAGRKAAS